LGPLRGIFLEEEYDIRPYLPNDMMRPRILDLGANVGFSAAYFSALFPGCEVICCEPDPRNVPLLRRTIESNHLNASVVEAAVASKPGTLRLRFGDNPTCSALESSPMHDLCDAVDVAVTTVPEVTESFGWNHIDILKIDIEGTEQELLGRGNQWLENVGVIVMEIHPNTSQDEIGAFLSPFGFQLERIGFAHEPVYFASRPGERRVNGKDGKSR
jgi:FkbM family methyltransferase